MATSSALNFYNSTPFIPSNQIVLLDTYTASAGQQTFFLTNKVVGDLGTTMQFGNTEYYLYNNGFTVGASSFTLASPQLVGTQGVAPGDTYLTLSAFDQDNVLGVAGNPRVGESPCWLIDPDTINNNKYNPLPSYSGLQVSFIQCISGSTPQTTWLSLASADASGNALTYGASGAPLYLPGITAFTTLASNVSAGASSITLSSSAGFAQAPGMYLSLDIGLGTSEIVHCIAASGNVLTLDPTGVTYSHTAGAQVFHVGWKFWAKMEIPLNATNNTAYNFYSIGLSRLGAIAARP